MYIRVWRYPVNFSVHYNIHYITFTILVRETWNDYPSFSQAMTIKTNIPRGIKPCDVIMHKVY